MFDSRIELSRRTVVREAQRRRPAGVHERGGAMKEHEAEGLNVLEPRERRVLARPAPAFRPGVDLRVGQHVVREDHQLLPRMLAAYAIVGTVWKARPPLRCAIVFL